MIIVEVLKENDLIVGISAKGHSGYEEIGKDIVCSAVSVAIEVTVNLLNKFDIDIYFNTDENVPIMTLELLSYNKTELMILENLVEVLKSIEEQYYKFLKINEIRR